MRFITVLVVVTLSVYLINALPANLIKDQETTIVPNEHEFVEHKKLEKRAVPNSYYLEYLINHFCVDELMKPKVSSLTNYETLSDKLI
ncbi:hypothetical protein C2G38_2158403 [Gigaspora rosea]|uniref:Uncharacterized protein n=1 Tax=Gigaspora rosea TaxID=44941 RepID=A0A397W244_9GLOM|nr:hypothetical protein C2G38_2158403 [Gigaspora rosea]